MKLIDRLEMMESIFAEPSEEDYVGAARAAQTALENATREVGRSKIELQKSIAKINGNLAMAVRLEVPGLNINLERDCCTVGYYARAITFRPNIQAGVWDTNSPSAKLLTSFLKLKPPLALVHDASPLAVIIGRFFALHYRSLGEDIIGTGKIFIEGKLSGLPDLVKVRG